MLSQIPLPLFAEGVKVLPLLRLPQHQRNPRASGGTTREPEWGSRCVLGRDLLAGHLSQEG